MEINQAIADLESSESYKGWQKGDYYLVHLFRMSETALQIGFYSRTTEKAICFEMHDPVTMLPESDVLKEEDSHLSPLDIAAVKVGLDQAMARAKLLAEEKFPQEHIAKDILLLQAKESLQYNLTFITLSQKLINIKIDAVSGEVLSYEIHSLMDFAKPA